MSVEEQPELRTMLAEPKPRYCDNCYQPRGWRSIIVEVAPWFTAFFSFSLVGGVFPLLFGIDSSFLNALTGYLQSAGYENIAQYFRVMNLGWPVVGAMTGFLVSAHIRNLYRQDRIGLVKRRVPIFGWYLYRLYYKRQLKVLAKPS